MGINAGMGKRLPMLEYHLFLWKNILASLYLSGDNLKLRENPLNFKNQFINGNIIKALGKTRRYGQILKFGQFAGKILYQYKLQRLYGIGHISKSA